MSDKFKKGDKVHYVPYDGCTNEECRNGVVKNPFNGYDNHTNVSFGCENEPENFMKYKGELTPDNKLEPDWVEQHFPEPEESEEEEL